MDYIEAYGICKKSVDNNYLIPDLNNDEILKLISREDWLMFKLEDEIDKNEARQIARPNIYIRIKGDKFKMGLTLNQINAVRWFIEIAEGYNQEKKQEIIGLLHKLSDNYITYIDRKIKDNFYAQVPKYIQEESFKSNQMDDEKVNKLCDKAKRIEEEGKQKAKFTDNYYSEFPAINLASIELELIEQNLKNATNDLFPILAKCLTIERRKKIPQEIENLVNKIKEQKQWWFYIKENDIILNKLNPKPDQETFKKAINIIRKSEEYKTLKEEWGC